MHNSLIVVQSLSHVSLFVTAWTAARQAPLSFTISWNILELMSIESVMPSNHLTCPQSHLWHSPDPDIFESLAHAFTGNLLLSHLWFTDCELSPEKQRNLPEVSQLVAELGPDPRLQASTEWSTPPHSLVSGRVSEHDHKEAEVIFFWCQKLAKIIGPTYIKTIHFPSLPILISIKGLNSYTFI